MNESVVEYDATHNLTTWKFPGGAVMELYVSEGHRACLKLQDNEGMCHFFQEYPWEAIEYARRQAEGIKLFGLTIMAGIEGRMVA
jgi:hypothetical protein